MWRMSATTDARGSTWMLPQRIQSRRDGHHCAGSSSLVFIIFWALTIASWEDKINRPTNQSICTRLFARLLRRVWLAVVLSWSIPSTTYTNSIAHNWSAPLSSTQHTNKVLLYPPYDMCFTLAFLSDIHGHCWDVGRKRMSPRESYLSCLLRFLHISNVCRGDI